MEHFSHDEAALEVAVDDACGSRCKSTTLDGPSADFISTASEVVNQVEGVVTREDDLTHLGVSIVGLAVLLLLLGLENLLLVLDGEGDNLGIGRALGAPLEDLSPVLVLGGFRELILAHVDEVDNRLGGEELELVKGLDVVVAPGVFTDVGTSLEALLGLLEGLKLTLLLLALIDTTLNDLGDSLVLGEDSSKVLSNQLLGDNLEITHGVNSSLNVLDVNIREGTAEVVDRIDGLNVRKELVTKTCTFGSTTDETGDIVHGQERRDLALGLVDLAQTVEARIGHGHMGVGGINRAERIVLSGHIQLAQQVEHGRLADL